MFPCAKFRTKNFLQTPVKNSVKLLIMATVADYHCYHSVMLTLISTHNVNLKEAFIYN